MPTGMTKPLAAGLLALTLMAATQEPPAPPQKRIMPPPEEGRQAPPDTVTDETLLALNVHHGLEALEDIASPEALRAAGGYGVAGNSSGEKDHIAGTGFLSQGWNTGLDSRTHSATNLTAQYGLFGTTVTVGTGGP